MILDQRSDIEQFFLEALEQVKEEKRRQTEAEGGYQATEPQFLPLVDGNQRFASKAASFEQTTKGDGVRK